jgi:hypothetical protein
VLPSASEIVEHVLLGFWAPAKEVAHA